MPVHHLASWRRTGHRGERRALDDDDGESARRCSPAADERIMNELARGAPLASFTPVNSTKSKVTNHEHLRQASNRTAGPLSAARARRPGYGVGATGHYRTGSPSTRPEDGSLPAPPTASLPPPSREGPSGRHCARPPPSSLCLPHALVPRRHLLPSIGVLGLSAGRPPPFTLGQPRRPRAAPRSQIAVLILFPRFSMMQRRRFLNKPSIASLPPRQSLVRQNFHLKQGVLPR